MSLATKCPSEEADVDAGNEDASVKRRRIGEVSADQGLPTARDSKPSAGVSVRSPSSDSGSSSSTSSDSDSESEAEPAAISDALENQPAEEKSVPEVSQYDVVKQAILKRCEIAKLLDELPLEAARDAILRCFVRLAVHVPTCDQDSMACVLAEVVGLEACPPYHVVWPCGRCSTLRVKLRCKRGSSQRLVKITSVSNRDLEEAEHDQWSKLTARTGVDARIYMDSMLRKAEDIIRARSFKFDEPTVAGMLKRKRTLEFDAQKESRMRFLLQCALSQMDISSKSDNEAWELEQRYKESLFQLHEQEAKAVKAQDQWFDKRPNLFSLKMINKKNYERQVRDDRHALEYTIETEQGGKEGLNPFQRRACRPIVAWDTELTEVEALSVAAPQVFAEDSAAKTDVPEEAPATTPETVEAPGRGAQRMERIVRAHSKARHILTGLLGLN